MLPANPLSKLTTSSFLDGYSWNDCTWSQPSFSYLPLYDVNTSSSVFSSSQSYAGDVVPPPAIPLSQPRSIGAASLPPVEAPQLHSASLPPPPPPPPFSLMSNNSFLTSYDMATISSHSSTFSQAATNNQMNGNNNFGWNSVVSGLDAIMSLNSGAKANPQLNGALTNPLTNPQTYQRLSGIISNLNPSYQIYDSPVAAYGTTASQSTSFFTNLSSLMTQSEIFNRIGPGLNIAEVIRSGHINVVNTASLLGTATVLVGGSSLVVAAGATLAQAATVVGLGIAAIDLLGKMSPASLTATGQLLSLPLSLMSGLGYPGSFDFNHFANLLQMTGLNSSYNSLHVNKPIVGLTNQGEIGGVAVHVGRIEDLVKSSDSVLFSDWMFAFKMSEGPLPFNTQALRRLLRELAVGIFLHETFPFFSLHFNEDCTLYPVMHPAYENTLVGDVISYLDYCLKGFLNGGVYEKEFLSNWHHAAIQNKSYLREHLVDLREYCKEHNIPNYKSLREKMAFRQNDEDDSENAQEIKSDNSERIEQKQQPSRSQGAFKLDHTSYSSSFRIIAKQKQILRKGNLFIITPDFDVKYTIELRKDYKIYLDDYYRRCGSYPSDYRQLTELYESMTHDIKEMMPKLPFCKPYFHLLGVISFFCYFFQTLKEIGKFPVLPPEPIEQPIILPKAFPNIPIRRICSCEFSLTLGQLFDDLKRHKKEKLDAYLRSILDNEQRDFILMIRGEIEEVFRLRLKNTPMPEEKEEEIKTDQINTQINIRPKPKPEENILQIFDGDRDSLFETEKLLTGQFYGHMFSFIQAVLLPMYKQAITLESSTPSDIVSDFVEKIKAQIESPLLQGISPQQYAGAENDSDLKFKLLRDKVIQQYAARIKILKNKLTPVPKIEIVGNILEAMMQLVNDQHNILINIYNRYISCNLFRSEFLGQLPISQQLRAISQSMGARHEQCLRWIKEDSRAAKVIEDVLLTLHQKQKASVEDSLNKQITKLHAGWDKQQREALAKISEEISQAIDEQTSDSNIMKIIANMLPKNMSDIDWSRTSLNLSELMSKLKADIVKDISEQGEKMKEDVRSNVDRLKRDVRDKKREQLKEVEGGHKEALKACRAQFSKMSDQAKGQLATSVQAKIAFFNPDNLSDALTDLERKICAFSHEEKNEQMLSKFFGARLLKRLTYSELDIIDEMYTNKNHENFRIVGGCGVSLASMSSQALPMGAQILTDFSAVLYETPSETLFPICYGEKTYALFHLPISDNPYASILDCMPLVDSFSVHQDEILKANDFEVFAVNLGESLLEKNLDNWMEDAKDFSASILPLRKAFSTGLRDIKCKGMASKKFNPAAKDRAGQTLSHYAASCNGQLLKKMSLGKRKYLEQVDAFGNRPIHVAASAGNVSGLLYCVNQDPDSIEAKTHQGLTPLLLAAQNRQLMAVKKLIELQANINYRAANGLFALYLAIQNGHTDIAMLLVSIPSEHINYVLDNGNSALHLAIDMGQLQVALALIQNGAILSGRRKKDGYTPLFCAASKGYDVICKAILLDDFVLMDAQLDLGETALHIAASAGHYETVKLLVDEYKFDLNAVNIEGNTALMTAIRHGQIDIACYLADQETYQVDLSNSNGQTALLLAGMTNQFEIADILIERGANLLFKDQDGRSYPYYLLVAGKYYRYKKLNDMVAKNNRCTPVEVLCDCIGFNLVAEYSHKLLMDWFESEKKIPFTVEPTKGWELIHYAVKADNVGYVDQWLSGGFGDYFHRITVGRDQTKSLAYIAAQYGSFNCLAALLRVYDKPVSQYLYNSFQAYHLLHGAVLSGSTRIVEYVLSFCDDVNVSVDAHSNNVAHIAVSLGFEGIVQLLKRCGVDFARKNINELTVFHLAVEHDDEKMLKLLFKLEKRPEAWPDDLFNFALSRNSEKCLEVIKEKIQNPLITPVTRRHIIEVLTHAVDVNALNELDGFLRNNVDLDVSLKNSLLVRAVKAGFVAIVEFLLQHRATDNNILDITGFYVAAISNRQVEMLRLFHQFGLNLPHGSAAYQQCCRLAGSNRYLIDAIDNNFEALDQQKSALLQAMEHSDVGRFLSIVQEMPSTQLSFSNKGMSQPLFHWAFLIQSEKWVFPILKERGYDPLVKDQQGLNILFKIFLLSQEVILNTLQIIDHYWPEKKEDLLKQECQGQVTIWQFASELGKISLLVEWMGSVNLTNFLAHNKDTILHLGARLNHFGMVKRLFSNDADHVLDVNARNNQNVTPLILAAVNGNTSMVQFLLNHGADPNNRDIDGNTSLQNALLAEQLEVALQLIPVTRNLNGSNRLGRTTLMIAAQKGLSQLVNILIHETVAVGVTDDFGFTALHLAAAGNYVAVIDKLVAIGFDVNAQRQPQDEDEADRIYGLTPLHVAAQIGCFEALMTLVKHGADLHLLDVAKHTFVDKVILSKSFAIRQFSYVLHAFFRPEHGVSLLISAVSADNLDALRELYFNGYDLNAQNDRGMNLVHFAGIYNSVRSLVFLIRNNVGLERVNCEGDSPLHMAALRGSVGAIKFLCREGIDLNKKNNNEQTALHLACEKGQYGAVVQLVCMGANTQVVDKNDLTPVQVALQKGHIDIVNFLLAIGDPSLSVQRRNKLPEYIRKQFSGFKMELNTLDQKVTLAQENGSNSYHLAILLNQLDALQLLSSQRVEGINQPDVVGNTPLHLAALEHNAQAAIILAKYGAVLSIQNGDGHTSLDIAKITNQTDLIRCLEGVEFKLLVKEKESQLEDDVAMSCTCFGFFSCRNKSSGVKDLELVEVKEEKSPLSISLVNVRAIEQDEKKGGMNDQQQPALDIKNIAQAISPGFSQNIHDRFFPRLDDQFLPSKPQSLDLVRLSDFGHDPSKGVLDFSMPAGNDRRRAARTDSAPQELLLLLGLANLLSSPVHDLEIVDDDEEKSDAENCAMQ